MSIFKARYYWESRALEIKQRKVLPLKIAKDNEKEGKNTHSNSTLHSVLQDKFYFHNEFQYKSHTFYTFPPTWDTI